MAEVAVQRELFQAILDWAAEIARSGIRMKGKVKGVTGEQRKPRKRCPHIREKKGLRAAGGVL